jgi:glycerol-3-phosphate dehydrogenase
VGTSDIPIDHADEARCTDEEVDYFLEMIHRVFPDIKVDPAQILYRFSGVRPLPRASKNTYAAQISRDHSIEVISGDWTNLLFPVYSLVGGKWTSFRAFSEEVTNKALGFLGMKRQKSTRELPIGGGRGYPKNEAELKKQVDGLVAWTGMKKERISALFERYGTRAETVANFILRNPDHELKSLSGYTRREIMFIVQSEKVNHLDDLVIRRTMLAMLGQLNMDILKELAGVVAESLNWSNEQKDAEVKRTLVLLEDRHGVRL